MKKELSKREAILEIERFFTRDNFTPEEVKTIKKLAMKFRIRLGDKRANFCKKCFSKLKGKTRISRVYRTVECQNCGLLNRLRIKHAS